MIRADLERTILAALIGTGPTHAMRGPELAARTGLDLPTLTAALHVLQRGGRVTVRDIASRHGCAYLRPALTALRIAQARGCSDGLRAPVRTAKVRKCLCCPREFVSEGPHHRLCPTCRAKSTQPYDL